MNNTTAEVYSLCAIFERGLSELAQLNRTEGSDQLKMAAGYINEALDEMQAFKEDSEFNKNQSTTQMAEE